jgi:hypothetical protein
LDDRINISTSIYQYININKVTNTMHASPRTFASGSSPSPLRGKGIPEGPIQDFSTVIENTPAEDWQKRVSALETLVRLIPVGSEYTAGSSWYNSPAILRHLANPLSELLRDARSTVVKRACEAATELFGKCQVDARYLLKDIMPHILAVHAQTVQVIRTYVQNMVIDTLSVVPCKMAMPIWLDRLKSDKSRTVREACALYLGVALQEWTEEGYLTTQIWDQVGMSLVKALRDSAPAVRSNAKRSMETLYNMNRDVFDKLFANADLTRDARVRKLLLRIQSGETLGDDVSVASSRMGGGSVASRSYRPGGSVRQSSVRDNYNTNNNTNNYNNKPPNSSPNYMRSRPPSNRGIPTTIGVESPPPATVTTTPVPPRANKPSRGGGGSGGGGGLGPPMRVAPFKAAIDSPPAVAVARHHESQRSKPVISNGAEPLTPGSNDDDGDDDGDVAATGESFDTADPVLPVIASKLELTQIAQTQRLNSRRSSLLQERLSKSHYNISGSSGTLEISLPDTNDDLLDDILAQPSDEIGGGTGASASGAVSNGAGGEHSQIAHQLLEVHKSHVDQIMETLKIEMDALKDFEQVLLEDNTRPSEEEVLDYFESVGLCLDQRTTAGNILRRAMDRISKGSS